MVKFESSRNSGVSKFLAKESFIGNIQNELLSVMHNDVLRQIISDVNQSPYLAVIMDETDI